MWKESRDGRAESENRTGVCRSEQLNPAPSFVLPIWAHEAVLYWVRLLACQDAILVNPKYWWHALGKVHDFLVNFLGRIWLTRENTWLEGVESDLKGEFWYAGCPRDLKGHGWNQVFSLSGNHISSQERVKKPENLWLTHNQICYTKHTF